MKYHLRYTNTIIALAAGATLAGAPRLAAQAGGPFAPVVLLLPASARALGMGNMDVAGRDDDVLFYNPAQLAVARAELSVSGERYSSTASGGDLSATTRIGNGGVGIGYQTVSYEGLAPLFPADRASMLEPGQSATSNVITAGIGQTFKRMHFGVAVKYADDYTQGLPESWVATDVGVSKDFGRSLTVGLAVQNIGPSATVDCASTRLLATGQCAIPVGGNGVPSFATVELPLRTTLGAAGAHDAGPFDLAWTAGVSMLKTNFVIPAGGLELGYSWLDGYDVLVRVGARRPLPGEQAVAGGAALSIDRMTFDYALEPLAGGHVGQRLGIRIR